MSTDLIWCVLALFLRNYCNLIFKSFNCSCFVHKWGLNIIFYLYFLYLSSIIWEQNLYIWYSIGYWSFLFYFCFVSGFTCLFFCFLLYMYENLWYGYNLFFFLMLNLLICSYLSISYFIIISSNDLTPVLNSSFSYFNSSDIDFFRDPSYSWLVWYLLCLTSLLTFGPISQIFTFGRINYLKFFFYIFDLVFEGLASTGSGEADG